jgi:hypothetical protein
MKPLSVKGRLRVLDMNSEMNSYRAWKAGSKRGSSLSLSLWIFSAGNRGAPRLYSPAKRITSSEWCPLLNPFRHYCYTLQFSRQDLRRTGILSRLSRRRPERNAARKRKRPKERERERERERRECIRIRNKVAYLHGEIAIYIRTADCKLHRKSWGVI